MLYQFNKAIIQVNENIHRLPAIGLIEYHFLQKELILKVFVNNILIATFNGNQAKELYMETNGEKRQNVLLTESQVKRIAAECVGVDVSLLESKTRNMYAVWGRYLVYSYFREHSIYSLTRIGSMFEQKKDHATVLHGLKELKNNMISGWRKLSKNSFDINVTELHNKL